MSATPASRQPLGLPDFTFADLHLPERLAELHTRFADEVRGLEPELWARWEAHRAAPAALGPVDRSAVLVALAPHVSRFVARLFAVGDEAARMGLHPFVPAPRPPSPDRRGMGITEEDK